MAGRGKNFNDPVDQRGKSGEDFVEKARDQKSGGRFKLVKMGLGFVGILEIVARAEHRGGESRSPDFSKELASNKWDAFKAHEINVALFLNFWY